LIQQTDLNLLPFDAQNTDNQGFVIYPFEEQSTCPAVFIRNDIFLKNPIISFRSEHIGEVVSIDKNVYLQCVEQFIEVTKSDFDKLIFSRIVAVPAEIPDLFEVFLTLQESYPDAFVYLFNLPNIGCWMGASPEIFLTKKENHAKTVALAGTQKDKGLPLDTVVWGEKEQKEQAIVAQYIENLLSKRKINFQKTTPETVKAGRMLHLKTHFYFELSNKIYDFLKNLHPTPAVCGLPKMAAKNYILENEPHDRAYYCGFLGTMNIENETNLFVNLRCMQVFKDKFALYVGGGITPDSISENEWNETVLKSQTLLSVLKNYDCLAI
jgi:isochorismate synthase